MKYLLSTGCSINKVPKVRHCNNQYTNKDTFLLTRCMSKMFSDMVHFIQKYIYMIFFT